MKKQNFFLYYILISLSILLLALRNNQGLINKVIILGIISFLQLLYGIIFMKLKVQLIGKIL